VSPFVCAMTSSSRGAKAEQHAEASRAATRRREARYSVGMGGVRVERHDSVWTLVLDRPPANAVDVDVIVALADALGVVESADCRALVVTGAGRFFSGGIDVKAVPRYDAATRSRMLRTINATVARLYALAKPVVAAVNGHALGAGLVLGLACDMRLAAAGEYAVGLTEATAGIPFPAVPLLVVEAEVTQRAARLATATGASVDPATAARTGFVDEILPAASLAATARARAEALAALSGYAAVKAQLRRATIDRMRRVVDADDEPLHTEWIGARE
jgi:enoyl-CoA hydratase